MAQFRKDTYEYLPQEKTLFEVVMLADQYGNQVGGANPTGMAVDAFGRARSSQPYTLFESFHRYQDNGKITTANSATGSSYSHNPNQGCIDCTITNTANSYIYRESSRVFPYQPGKSLQVLETFVLAPAQTGLRQRYGYFGSNNGLYLEQDGHTVYFVRRSFVTGSVVNTRVAQADWNMDPLDGTGPSHLTLDLTRAQILFIDVEWLGVGSVRMGFVINGRFIHCHTFNHANEVGANTTYMSTACLPVRAEIENTNSMANTSTLKIICATVISEGGFEPKGKPRSVGIPVSTPKDIPTAGTFTPLISIRLKDSRQDSVAFLRSVQFFGVTNNTSYRYKLVAGATLTGASWVSAGDDSSVEYDMSATAYSGGNDLRVEYVNVSSGAGAASSQIDPSDIYKYQLERNSFATSNNGIVFSLVATGAANGNDACGAISWEELT